MVQMERCAVGDIKKQKIGQITLVVFYFWAWIRRLRFLSFDSIVSSRSDKNLTIFVGGLSSSTTDRLYEIDET